MTEAEGVAPLFTGFNKNNLETFNVKTRKIAVRWSCRQISEGLAAPVQRLWARLVRNPSSTRRSAAVVLGQEVEGLIWNRVPIQGCHNPIMIGEGLDIDRAEHDDYIDCPLRKGRNSIFFHFCVWHTDLGWNFTPNRLVTLVWKFWKNGVTTFS